MNPFEAPTWVEPRRRRPWRDLALALLMFGWFCFLVAGFSFGLTEEFGWLMRIGAAAGVAASVTLSAVALNMVRDIVCEHWL